MVWTEITRRDYDRKELRYASDCSDAERAIIRPFLQRHGGLGRFLCHDLRHIWNALNYIITSGCQWRLLPTVQYHFYRWRAEGLLECINDALVEACRIADCRTTQPTAGVIYSQSVKTTQAGGERGYDARKKIKGRKRHIITDTMGNFLGATFWKLLYIKPIFRTVMAHRLCCHCCTTNIPLSPKSMPMAAMLVKS